MEEWILAATLVATSVVTMVATGEAITAVIGRGLRWRLGERLRRGLFGG